MATLTCLVLRRMAPLLALLTLVQISAFGQTPVTNDPPQYGPFNVVLLPDGDGAKKTLLKDDSVLRPDSPWTLSAWVRGEEPEKASSLVVGVGEPGEEFPRYLAVDGAHLLLWLGQDNVLSGGARLDPLKWHMLAATFDGTLFRLYNDGAQVASGKLDLGSVSPILQIGPPVLPAQTWRHFGGHVAGATLQRSALTSDEIRQLCAAPTRILVDRVRRGFSTLVLPDAWASRLPKSSGPSYAPAQQSSFLTAGRSQRNQGGGCSRHGQRCGMGSRARLVPDACPGSLRGWDGRLATGLQDG